MKGEKAASAGHRAQQIRAELARLQDEVTQLTRGEEPRGAASLQHEISVYQEELIIQNEALIGAQAALEETRDRFIELYDFAPNGYLTLDPNGVIRGCNLTAAAMIGRPKAAVEGLTLLGMVLPEDRGALVSFLRTCRKGAVAQIEGEFLFRTANGPRRMQLLCRGHFSGESPSEIFTSMIDVTERRQLERERDQLAHEHAALASRLLSAQEDERRRIARNLHDDAGQETTALRLMVERLIAEASSDKARTQLSQVLNGLGQLDDRLHRISAGLRPSALDLGIVPAIRQLLGDWSASSGVAVSFHADDLPDHWLDPDVETHVFRILQEALTNVAKHAGASRVAVVLNRLHTGVSLVVDDDGNGFDMKGVRTKAGLGLIGMRERVQLLGGQLNVSAANPGTVVSVTVLRSAPAPSPTMIANEASRPKP